jgi:hypothetical protein
MGELPEATRDGVNSLVERWKQVSDGSVTAARSFLEVYDQWSKAESQLGEGK